MGLGFESQQDHASKLGAENQRIINEFQRLFSLKSEGKTIKKKAKNSQKSSKIVIHRQKLLYILLYMDVYNNASKDD